MGGMRQGNGRVLEGDGTRRPYFLVKARAVCKGVN